MKKILVLFILSIGCAALNCADAQSLYISYIDSADVNIRAKNWLQAERFLLLALKQEPANNNNSLLISNLATVQRYQRKYGEALKNYDVALSLIHISEPTRPY